MSLSHAHLGIIGWANPGKFAWTNFVKQNTFQAGFDLPLCRYKTIWLQYPVPNVLQLYLEVVEFSSENNLHGVRDSQSTGTFSRSGMIWWVNVTGSIKLIRGITFVIEAGPAHSSEDKSTFGEVQQPCQLVKCFVRRRAYVLPICAWSLHCSLYETMMTRS